MKNVSLLAAASVLALGGLASEARAQTGYSTSNVQFPTDPAFTQLNGINDAGATVGTHNAATNMGFLRSPSGVFTNVTVPGAASTQVLGIAGNGTRVGIFVDPAGTTHGFAQLPQAVGTLTSVFDQPGTAFNQLLGISGNGSRFAGYSSTDPAGMILQKAYQGAIADHSFADVNHLLPANFNSQATGVNDAGKVVGFYQPTAETSVGFLDVNGVITTLDPFGSAFTQALGISGAGEIVGFYTDAAGMQHGYTDIGGTFASFDPTGSVSTTINGVNDRGQLVGFYTNVDDQVVGFLTTPVAEPGSVAVLGVGMLGLFGATRRRAV